jgi:hypothetical protein
MGEGGGQRDGGAVLDDDGGVRLQQAEGVGVKAGLAQAVEGSGDEGPEELVGARPEVLLEGLGGDVEVVGDVLEGGFGIGHPAEDAGLGDGGAGEDAAAGDEADPLGEEVGDGAEEVLEAGGQRGKLDHGGSPFAGMVCVYKHSTRRSPPLVKLGAMGR